MFAGLGLDAIYLLRIVILYLGIGSRPLRMLLWTTVLLITSASALVLRFKDSDAKPVNRHGASILVVCLLQFFVHLIDKKTDS